MIALVSDTTVCVCVKHTSSLTEYQWRYHSYFNSNITFDTFFIYLFDTFSVCFLFCCLIVEGRNLKHKQKKRLFNTQTVLTEQQNVAKKK